MDNPGFTRFTRLGRKHLLVFSFAMFEFTLSETLQSANFVACVMLALPHMVYSTAWHAPNTYARLARICGYTDPVRSLSHIGYLLKVVQYSVALVHADFSAYPPAWVSPEKCISSMVYIFPNN